jgi:hypothetical protein
MVPRWNLVWQPQVHFIVAHVPVERIESEELALSGDPAAVHENHQLARILPARDGVRQPKQLTQIRRPKESLRRRGAMPFDIQSKGRLRTVTPSTSSPLYVS